MHGFKSFANKTEISFDKGVNVIIGPNGSGKSNISDALCFVLGRLSTKSIRAAKAKNLLFMGSKYVKPSREAVVELVFDNMDRTFPIDENEINITRIVRSNGLSVYKINNESKTRAEIIDMLAQAGIDPHGFNLVLQGQIQSVVRMHPEDRRKIVEEVAGISIYESRKTKSLHELEKTEERLKEINAILRERSAFLKNLENERSQALRFKELELTVKRCKASIIQKKIEERETELAAISKSIDERAKNRDSLKAKSAALQQEIESMQERIHQINKHIQHSTGIEQETLRNQIANYKIEIEGMRVRKEGLEHRREEIQRKSMEVLKTVPDLEKEIAELRHESPLMAKKQKELAKKKEELAAIEEERKKAYLLQTELQALKDRLRDKEAQSSRVTGESDAVMKQLEEYAINLKYSSAEECKKVIAEITKELDHKKKSFISEGEKELRFTGQISSYETEIRNAQSIQSKVEKIDICPLCQSNITADHIAHVTKEAQEKIQSAQKLLDEQRRLIDESRIARRMLTDEIREHEQKLIELERERTRHQVVQDKQDYLKRLVDQEKLLQQEIKELISRRDTVQQKSIDASQIDERYSSALMEIQEISSRTEKDLDQTLLFKERELEKSRDIVRLAKQDLEKVSQAITEFAQELENKSKLLVQKQKEDEELNDRFKKLFAERDDQQRAITEKSYEVSNLQSKWVQIEEQINHLKVGDAKYRAEKESFEMEMTEYLGLEIIKASLNALEEKLQKSQQQVQQIGSINLRALEIYDEIKQEYDRVQEKVTTLLNEKEDILRIVQEIDNKKRRTFMKTFNQINELFTRNFIRLSTKGQASLELENPEDIFAGGVSIAIKMGRGKHMDVSSLSGGEQTLIALSLLFAIQEYKPYHFYVLDEIDAALDKRNAEKLSVMLKQYMKSGQYITVTHNDALIMDADVLYGVSMHEGVSKILSLKAGEKESIQPQQEISNSNPENFDSNLDKSTV